MSRDAKTRTDTTGERTRAPAGLGSELLVLHAPLGNQAIQRMVQQARGNAGPSTPAVQRTPLVIQRSIRDDLIEAVDGLGTDEDAIYDRLRRATTAELRSVVADRELMGMLEDDLSREEMLQVMDSLPIPLKDKLQMAMSGWGTDEDYILRTLNAASSDELTALAADENMLNTLEDELSGEDLKRVLERLNIPLDRKLKFAMRGWGTDEQYIYDSLAAAPIDQAMSLAQNTTLLRELDGDLTSGEENQLYGKLARRVSLEGTNNELAFTLLMGDDATRNARLVQFGSLAEQRALCHENIQASSDLQHVLQAFESYWNVDTDRVEGTREWSIDTLRAIHNQLLLLPEQDARNGVWSRLTMDTGSGGSMSSSGNFKLGEDAAGGDAPYGVGTRLSEDVAAGATEIKVEDVSIFSAGDAVQIGNTTDDVHAVASVDASANKYTLDAALTVAHTANQKVIPTDGTGIHRVDWLDAVVRHEIAHSVDTAIGGTRGFADLGGWWTGQSFESWVSAMGNAAWRNDDGVDISPEDRAAIQQVITSARGTDGGNPLNNGLAADHAVSRYWDKHVPVIEAAKPCVETGMDFWQSPTRLLALNGKRFAMNLYYHEFQYYDDIVHTRRVRDYAIFSPAEFFAEVYTVYYEEAGMVTDEELGRRVPVASWKDWITQHVHNRNLEPSAETEASVPGPAVGKSAGKSG